MQKGFTRLGFVLGLVGWYAFVYWNTTTPATDHRLVIALYFAVTIPVCAFFVFLIGAWVYDGFSDKKF